MNRCTQYRPIGSFGQGAATDPNANPLTYCLIDSIDTSFAHGQNLDLRGPQTKKCQMFMSDYCAKDWNGVCEFAFQNRNKMVPNMLQSCQSYGDAACVGLTEGQILLRNTASKKYLSAISNNCSLKYEPFDPTVASSPMVSYWTSSCNAKGACVPMYEVDPSKIDSDVVMNKILSNPKIAWGVLVNIYNTAVRKGTLPTLQGTKLYKFFQSQGFQKYIHMSTTAKKHMWQ